MGGLSAPVLNASVSLRRPSHSSAQEVGGLPPPLGQGREGTLTHSLTYLPVVLPQPT